MSFVVPSQYLEITRNDEIPSSSSSSKNQKAVTAVFSHPDQSNVFFVGTRDGKLSRIDYNNNNNNNKSICIWKTDAQCGPVKGISASQNFVAAFGIGDSCVNIFHHPHQINNNNNNDDEIFSTNETKVSLRWQCTGHVFSITAVALLVSSAHSPSPLVVTCSSDGMIRLFDLQRTSTSALANVVVAASDGSGDKQQQVQVVSALTQTSIPSSLNAVPRAFLLPTNTLGEGGTTLAQSGNILVWCEALAKMDKKSCDEERNNETKKKLPTTLIQVDVLGKQRYSSASTNASSYKNTTSSSSLIHDTDLKREVTSTSNLLQVLNITSLDDLLSSATTNNTLDKKTSSSVRVLAASWNSSEVSLLLAGGEIMSVPLLATTTRQGHTSNSSNTDDEKKRCSSRLFTAISSISATTMENREERILKENLANIISNAANLSSGKSKAAKLAAVIANFNLRVSGTRRPRGDNNNNDGSDELESTIERCRETAALIEQLRSSS